MSRLSTVEFPYPAGEKLLNNVPWTLKSRISLPFLLNFPHPAPKEKVPRPAKPIGAPPLC